MVRIDPLEAEIMRDCQRGVMWETRYSRGGSGSFCKKRDLCRMERHCYFVAQIQRHMERVWTQPIPGKVVWSRGFDYDKETIPMFGAA